ncbi:hypothetical protein DESUT3_03030 [Desulfuromonas versatilis]|uniref:DUF2760 domain-containing protein n=1 Tax=Desulfuromonas versatilis TaxID=2802975 RepID=A0ABM8HM09_9BACT|nr:DUF2760 domain-containing protein [Desulfuromonas versatilis]BCR03234.1 hypothetical protein DESUT3_03030 [Desulfuromonas versatilis]
MDLLLTLIILALANVLFFYPLEPRYVPALQVAVSALLGVLFVLETFYLIRRRIRKTEEEELLAIKRGAAAPAPAAPAVAVAPEAAVEAGVVQFLARLQEKGRLVDFVMDDITPYSNEQVGAAARVVHQGCREVLQSAFEIKPVHGGEEREELTLSGDFDAAAYRLVGKVPEQPPYKGVVLHRGWKTARVSLPRISEAAREAAAREVIAPAEVEIA